MTAQIELMTTFEEASLLIKYSAITDPLSFIVQVPELHFHFHVCFRCSKAESTFIAEHSQAGY